MLFRFWSFYDFWFFHSLSVQLIVSLQFITKNICIKWFRSVAAFPSHLDNPGWFLFRDFMTGFEKCNQISYCHYTILACGRFFPRFWLPNTKGIFGFEYYDPLTCAYILFADLVLEISFLNSNFCYMRPWNLCVYFGKRLISLTSGTCDSFHKGEIMLEFF